MASSAVQEGLSLGVRIVRQALYRRQRQLSFRSGPVVFRDPWLWQRRWYGDPMVAEALEEDGVILTEHCAKRLAELNEGETGETAMLRLSVEGGGCSGFQYSFELDSRRRAGDRVFERDGSKLVVDDISFPFVKGATVDYAEELIRSAFTVVSNPNSSASCGCGASFTAK